MVQLDGMAFLPLASGSSAGHLNSPDVVWTDCIHCYVPIPDHDVKCTSTDDRFDVW